MLKISLTVFITSVILFSGTFFVKWYMENKVNNLEIKVTQNKAEEDTLLNKINQMKVNIEELENENKEKIEEFELWQHQNEKLEEILKPYR